MVVNQVYVSSISPFEAEDDATVVNPERMFSRVVSRLVTGIHGNSRHVLIKQVYRSSSLKAK